MRRVESAEGLGGLSHDAGLEVVVPKAAYFAESEGDVVEAMGDALTRGLSITPRGGGTGIPSQSVGPGAVVVLAGRSASVDGDLVTCGPGIVKADLNGILSVEGRWLPVDPSSSSSCTVGGMVANNSSGARSLKYGSTIDYVRGLGAVIPEGEAVSLGCLPLGDARNNGPLTKALATLLIENRAAIEEERPKVTKNSSGYRLERCVHDGHLDLARLFVGSEGTLGVVTRASLRTLSPPSWRVLLTLESSLEELGRVAGVLRGLGPSALEIVDKSVFSRVGREASVAPYSKREEPYLFFCELDGDSGTPEEALERVSASDAGGFEPLVMTEPSEIKRAWGLRSETLKVAGGIRDGGKSLVPGVEDLVVPPERLGDLVTLLSDQFGRRGCSYILYGHAGDANLHARPLMDISAEGGKRALHGLMQDCFEEVWKMGGSMTGEHGDGRLRAGFLEMQYPRTYWIMKEVKSIFDPKGVMNPGVKLP